MVRIRLGLYEIKKSITASRIAFILLVSLILILYSLSFNGALDFIADDNLYSILKKYEMVSGDRTALLNTEAEESLYKFYESDDIATSTLRSLFNRIETTYNYYNDSETLKTAFCTNSLFTASIMISFHEFAFWMTVAASIVIALLCGFIGLKEKNEKIDYYNTCLYGKDSARNRFSAVLICSIIVILTAALLSFCYIYLTVDLEALREPIYSRYAPQLLYQTNNMSFAAYCSLAVAVYSLFSVACAMLDFQITEFFDGSISLFLIIPAEIILQVFFAKIMWLGGVTLSWKVGGVFGLMFDGFDTNGFPTARYSVTIPVILISITLLLAGNLLTIKYKRNAKRVGKCWN